MFYKGKIAGSVREYSDALRMFLMKAARPERFRDGYDLTKFFASLPGIAGK